MADLDLTEAIEAAVEAAGWSWDPNGDPNIPTPGECMAEILEAAAPFIERQIGERIAEAIEREAATLDHLPPTENDATLAYRQGMRHGMAGAPEHDLIGAAGIARQVVSDE